MTASAKALQIVHVPRIAAAPERLDVIAFQPAGEPARPTAVAVPLEHGAAHRSPLARVEARVISAH